MRCFNDLTALYPKISELAQAIARWSPPGPLLMTRWRPLRPRRHRGPPYLAHRGRRSKKSQARRRLARQGRHPARRSRRRLRRHHTTDLPWCLRAGCRCYQPVCGDAGCLGGAPGPFSLAHHVLSRGDSEINLQVPFAVEGLLSRRLGLELLDSFVRGKLFVADGLCFEMLDLGVDRFT